MWQELHIALIILENALEDYVGFELYKFAISPSGWVNHLENMKYLRI